MQTDEAQADKSGKEKSNHFWKYAVMGLVSAAILLGFILWAYYPAPAVWTGFGDFTTPAGDFVRRKTLWDWLDLLIIPVALGLGALYFNTKERERERDSLDARAELERRSTEARAELERELNTENQRESALQSYLDRMAELLLSRQLDVPGNYAGQDVARIRTLTVLRALDPIRKGLVMIFLHEAGLIHHEQGIKLADADLSGADLIGAKLIKARLMETNLSRARLGFSDLTRADLTSANLSKAALAYASLIEATLMGAMLEGADLTRANLEGADLTKADLIDANLSGANLKGADLTDAFLSNESIAITPRDYARVMKDPKNKYIRLPLNEPIPEPVHKQARFMYAIYDRATVWPEGFDPKAAGAILKEEEDYYS